jgi:hypothetical protein
LCWIGKDRKGRRGGGVGFVVRKVLKPRVAMVSNNSNILWLEVEKGEKWYIAVVYLVPKEQGNTNDMTLMELQQGILRFTGKGRIVVFGDFNARVGNLPNIVNII